MAGFMCLFLFFSRMHLDNRTHIRQTHSRQINAIINSGAVESWMRQPTLGNEAEKREQRCGTDRAVGNAALNGHSVATRLPVRCRVRFRAKRLCHKALNPLGNHDNQIFRKKENKK
jgi:hypothetical protein